MTCINRIKKISLLLALVLFFSGCATSPCKLKVTQGKAGINFSNDLFSFGSDGIDWKALEDPGNNPILNECISGCNLSDLRKLKIPDLEVRLSRLEKGQLLRRSNENYALTFPIIEAKQRELLQASVKKAALILLPELEKITQELKSNLNNDNMLFHVLWSCVMDSMTAWLESWETLIPSSKLNNLWSKNYAWLVYPPHPAAVGTNILDLPATKIIITWNKNASEHRKVLKKYRKEIDRAIFTNKQITDKKTKKDLQHYGIVNAKGKSNVLIYVKGTEKYNLFERLAKEYGKSLAEALDLQKISKELNLPQDLCFIIAYHQLSWELLGILEKKGILEVPQILLKPNPDYKQAYRLVSFCITKPF